MTTKHTPTSSEIKALICCIDPKGSAEGMLSDSGQVMSGLPEFMDALGWNKKQVAALIGSMEEKGYGSSDENDGNGHIFWPSKEGYEIAYAEIAKAKGEA